MSTVTLTIGPKSYAVACADGEEPHIAALGAMIAEKYAQLGTSRAPLEAQNMLFAALFMADELAETRKQLAACQPDQTAGQEAQIAELQQKLDDALAAAAQAELRAPDQAKAQASEQAAAQSADAGTANAMVTRLELLATRAEAAADALEAGADNA
jgi:cell division protein ZapA